MEVPLTFVSLSKCLLCQWSFSYGVVKRSVHVVYACCLLTLMGVEGVPRSGFPVVGYYFCNIAVFAVVGYKPIEEFVTYRPIGERTVA